MENKINVKKLSILIISIIAIIIIITSIRIISGKIKISKQMKNAENSITINNDVKFYKKAKETKKSTSLDIGTNAYILENVIDKNNQKWSKVKIGKKIGYIKSDNLKSYKKDNMKKSLMLDVSKFNFQNNFKTIGEFKAFVLNNNIKYVYIRAGGRGYGKDGNFYEDANYKDFADACEFLKIPFGFYFLDEAITSDEVTEEYDFIDNFILKNKYEYNKLPVALDVEKHTEKGRADDIWDTRYNLVNELIEKLKNNNYNVILYSNANVANKYLVNVNSPMWLAYYPEITKISDNWISDTNAEGANNPDLVSKIVGWQFTHTGIKNKIDNKVDLSIVYGDFFRTGSMRDIENDVSGKSNEVSIIFQYLNLVSENFIKK